MDVAADDLEDGRVVVAQRELRLPRRLAAAERAPGLRCPAPPPARGCEGRRRPGVGRRRRGVWASRPAVARGEGVRASGAAAAQASRFSARRAHSSWRPTACRRCLGGRHAATGGGPAPASSARRPRPRGSPAWRSRQSTLTHAVNEGRGAVAGGPGCSTGDPRASVQPAEGAGPLEWRAAARRARRVRAAAELARRRRAAASGSRPAGRARARPRRRDAARAAARFSPFGRGVGGVAVLAVCVADRVVVAAETREMNFQIRL